MLSTFFKIKYRKIITLNHEESDCGVACLSSILKYYGKITSLENLRILTGTTNSGTSILGMCQASSNFNLDLKAIINKNRDLKLITTPCILLISILPNLYHYVVLLEKVKDKYIIIDPDVGIVIYKEKKLLELWQSGIILKIKKLSEQTYNSKNIETSNYKWLIDLLLLKKYSIIGSVFLAFFTVSLHISMLIFIQFIIDTIIPQQNIKILITTLLFVIFVIFLKALTTFFQKNLNKLILRFLNIKIMELFTDNFFQLPKSFFNNKNVGKSISRFNDPININESIDYFLNSSIKSIFIIIISVITISFFSFKIGLLTAILTPFIYLLSKLCRKKKTNQYKNIHILNSVRTEAIVNFIKGVDYIKLSNKESFFSKLNLLNSKSYQENIDEMVSFNSRSRFGIDILISISLIIVVLSSILLFFRNEISLGQLIAISTIFINLTSSITSVSIFNIQVKNLRIASLRIAEIIHLNPIIDSNLISLDSFNELVFKDVEFFYPGNKPIIENLNFKIKKNEFVCFIGENGIGKTTLVNLILGFYNPSKGYISINSKNINSINPKIWVNKIGLIEQFVPIFNGNICFNICLDNNIDIKKIVDFCKKNGFDDFISDLPNNYYTILGDNGIDLTNGQKQLFGIARALYKKPEFLIIDEPLSSLDFNTEKLIESILINHINKITIILISQKFNLTSKADIIYIMENGNISCSGTHKELLSFDNFYSQYFNLTVQNAII